MAQQGSLAANFHEGSRSEYLAQYVLSSLGMAALIPRQEDAGIDLQCALGQREGQRLLITQYYLAQVKSNSGFGTYVGKSSIKWLCSHRYPVLFVRVNKSESGIDIFQTAAIVNVPAGKVEKITLQPGTTAPSFESYSEEAEELVIDLGLPILSFNVSEVHSAAWRQHASDVLQSWLELDQANIDQKQYGVPIYSFPSSYSTNVVVEADQLRGNFKNDSMSGSKLPSVTVGLMKQLAVLVHRAAAEKNVPKFRVLCRFIKEGVLPAGEGDEYSKWLVNLVFAVNAGAEHLSLPDRVQIFDRNGKPLTLKVNIEGSDA